MATAQFTNETLSGWQEVLFGAPVPIVASTTYVASYYTHGWCRHSAFAFQAVGVDNPPCMR